jgi:hypothetical protein
MHASQTDDFGDKDSAMAGAFVVEDIRKFDS